MRRIFLVLALAAVVGTTAGCADHRAPLTTVDQGILQVLGLAQDSEMVAHQQGLIDDAAHRAFNVKLAVALRAGKAFNAAVRDWPADTPQPATILALAQTITQGVSDLLVLAPQASGLATLRGYLNAALGYLHPYLAVQPGGAR